MYDLVCIGEILVDLTQTGLDAQGIPQFSAYPGGAPANVAVAAGRLGAKCAFCGKVGQDEMGSLLVRTLKDNSVDASAVLFDQQPTTMALVSLTPEGERSFRFFRGADLLLDVDDVIHHLPVNTKLLHFGAVSLTAGNCRSATVLAVREARAHGAVISFDPNYRSFLWPSEESALQWMFLPLPMVDILKVSEEELSMMTGTADPAEGCKLLSKYNIPLILVTLGAQGVFYCRNGHTGHVPSVPTKVVDTNGAGDTFLGAVLSRLSQRPGAPLDGLEASELEDILAFANRAAAFTCAHSGAIPGMPHREDLI